MNITFPKKDGDVRLLIDGLKCRLTLVENSDLIPEHPFLVVELYSRKKRKNETVGMIHYFKTLDDAVDAQRVLPFELEATSYETQTAIQ